MRTARTAHTSAPTRPRPQVRIPAKRRTQIHGHPVEPLTSKDTRTIRAAHRHRSGALTGFETDRRRPRTRSPPTTYMPSRHPTATNPTRHQRRTTEPPADIWAGSAVHRRRGCASRCEWLLSLPASQSVPWKRSVGVVRIGRAVRRRGSGTGKARRWGAAGLSVGFRVRRSRRPGFRDRRRRGVPPCPPRRGGTAGPGRTGRGGRRGAPWCSRRPPSRGRPRR